MNKIQIGKQEVIHFIGIGGIGMSGLAQIMKTMGFRVQGSDINENKNTDNCKKLGIKILKGHSKKNTPRNNFTYGWRTRLPQLAGVTCTSMRCARCNSHDCVQTPT